MKRSKEILISVALITLLAAIPSPAPMVVPFSDLDTYVKNAKTVFIGECLSQRDEDRYYANAFYRRIRVKHVLLGTLIKEETVSITGKEALVPGTLYLIYSRVEVDKAGNLYTYSDSPAAVKIMPYSNDVVGMKGREKILSKLIKDLEGKSLKESLRHIFERRQRELKYEEEAVKAEMEIVDKALK
jgi:hypothetical protein